ncbi:hypothetical protein KIPB_014549, partial [Kipferlia bialata]|eukprot:g14549.t1
MVGSTYSFAPKANAVVVENKVFAGYDVIPSRAGLLHKEEISYAEATLTASPLPSNMVISGIKEIANDMEVEEVLSLPSSLLYNTVDANLEYSVSVDATSSSLGLPFTCEAAEGETSYTVNMW